MDFKDLYRHPYFGPPGIQPREDRGDWFVDVEEGALAMILRIKRPPADLEELAGLSEKTVLRVEAYRHREGWYVQRVEREDEDLRVSGFTKCAPLSRVQLIEEIQRADPASFLEDLARVLYA